VLHRHVHAVGARAIGAGRPVLTTVGARAHEDLLAGFGEHALGVDLDLARRAVDVLDDVLHDGGPRPEELARRAVERVDDARLARNARHHAAPLAGANARIDPGD